MEDPRIRQLAKVITTYSTEIRKGEKALIELYDQATPLTKAVIEEIYNAGGKPFLRTYDHKLVRTLMMGLDRELAEIMALHDRELMREMDVYIGIRAFENTSELSDIPGSSLETFMKHYMKPVHMEERVPNTRWVVLRYPNDSMAQISRMSTEGFEDFFFEACLVDYGKMGKYLVPLTGIMERTENVRIKGPGTDLSFSIKNIPVIPCHGRRNIPDGEVYTAPVRDSINGIITYNAPSPFNGFIFENVSFEFEKGQIIRASANNTGKLEEILDTDPGARYIGEFSLGVNPKILNPMGDTLFDEKIAGSFHLTPGNCYDTAPNGNSSSIHWDLVCIQRDEYGGGEIYFDDVLIRKDGLFTLKELEGLNPDRW